MFDFLRRTTRGLQPVIQFRSKTVTMAHTTRSWKRGELTPQEYFTFRDGDWHPVGAGGSAVPPGRETAPSSFQFSVLSWNVDFMAPEEDARMSAALKHLGSLVAARRLGARRLQHYRRDGRLLGVSRLR
ncbi:hypothetical protein VTH06DRAFT_1714 [Thermothelomyces fergusii]